MNMPFFIKITLLATILSDGVLIFLILNKRSKKTIHYLLLLSFMGILGWTISVYSILISPNAFAAKLSFFFALILIFFLSLFSHVFINGRLPDLKLRRLILYFLTALMLAGTLTDGSLFNSINLVNGYYIQVDSGYLSAYYSILISFYALMPVLLLYNGAKRKDISQLARKQTKVLFIGYLIFVIIGWLSNYILPIFFRFYLLNGIGPAFSMIFVGFLMLIIKRYSFLNLKLYIQRGLVYSFVFTIIAFLYLALISLFGLVPFADVPIARNFFAALLTILVGIFGVPVIDKYLRRWTDRIFFKGKYDYSSALFSLSEVLNRNYKIGELTAESLREIKNVLRVRCAGFVLPDKSLRLHIGKELKFYNEDQSWARDLDSAISYQRAESGEEPDFLNLEYDLRLPDLEMVRVAAAIPINQKKTGAALILGEKLSGDMFTHEDGKLLRTFAFQAGVAIEKAMLYEEVSRHSRELEKKVEERTAQIRGLQEDQKRMMLDLAHGLQTPLTIVKGELKALESEYNRNNVKHLEATIDHTSRIIYDMLRLARLETKSKAGARELLDLSDLLTGLSEDFDIICRQKNISFSKNIKPGIFIKGDKSELTEMVMNFVSNSIKYSKSRGRREIELDLLIKDGKALITIIDNGIGIAREDLKKLFNRFFRANYSSETKYAGTGLGLSICKEIIKRHHGDVSVSSQKGKGTSFIISFPANTANPKK